MNAFNANSCYSLTMNSINKKALQIKHQTAG